MKRKNGLLFLVSFLFFSFFFLQPAFAMDTQVSGVVTGVGTGPLANASIKVIDAQTKSVQADVRTDRQGQYSFFVPQGTYTIQIAGDGLTKTLTNQKIMTNTFQNFALGAPPKIEVSPPQTTVFGFHLTTFLRTVLLEIAAVICIVLFLVLKKKNK